MPGCSQYLFMCVCVCVCSQDELEMSQGSGGEGRLLTDRESAASLEETVPFGQPKLLPIGADNTITVRADALHVHVQIHGLDTS